MSLKSIAQEMRVAPSTVSRVLNRREDFSIQEELRQRILDRARELNYQPNAAYQAMRKKDNKNICIMIPCLLSITAGTDSTRAVDELCERLLRSDFDFHYLSRPNMAWRISYGLPLWKSAAAVAVDVRVMAQIDQLEASDIPYIALNGIAGPRGTSLRIDEKTTMRRVWDFLTGLGHRRIGYVNAYTPPGEVNVRFEDSHHSVRERPAYYAEHCRELGFEPAPESLRHEHSAPEVVDACLARGCTALIGYSPQMTLRILKHLRERGLRVPEDVSVMTYNNNESTELSYPALTVVDLPSKEMGVRAAEYLTQKYHDPKHAEGETLLFTGTILQRESTAAPKQLRIKN